jgi:hypothetical protein
LLRRFFFLNFLCYEVIVKQKIYKRSSNYYCVIYTDASSTIGFCAVLSDPQGERKSFSGWWSLEERVQWHITLKELVAVRRGIAMFQDDLRGRVMRLWEDNQAVVHHLQQNLAVARSHERAAIIGGTPRGPQSIDRPFIVLTETKFRV